ncbi:uncharacterized protein [Temnothorax longispinosus]|uniref:uncharacterized protein isoform X2 n=1 Tax=Temnothorax longispinosus TaxID=300112 RepID=UPI003A990702
MECKDDYDYVPKIKKRRTDKKDIKSRIEMSQDENNDLKKELKNKDTYKVEDKNKVIGNEKTSQNEDSDSTEESENEDTCKVKCKDKDVRNKKTTQDKDSDLKDKDTYKVKDKNKVTGNEIKTSQDEDSDSTEESENEDTCKVKCKDKDVRNKKTTQDKDSDLKDKDTCKVKDKNKVTGNEIKTSQVEDSDSTEESENEDTCSKVKCKDKDVRNKKTTQDKDSDLKDKDTCKVKDKNKVVTGNEIKTPQDEDSDSTEESENEHIHEIKCKNKDTWNEIETLQNEDDNLKRKLKNKDICKVEPSSDDEGVEEEYCSDATYLARQIASAERLSQEKLLQLHNLCVKLRHVVPPQHNIETRAGSHMPTREEIKEFERIIPIKRGSYSFKEDEIIAKNWKAFCKLHNWDRKKVKPFLQLRIGNLTYMRNTTERRKFVQFLADGLPDRTLYSVYHRFKNLYEDNVQRRYIPEEDEMIINHLEHNPSLDERRKYADLAKVLRRTRNSIWRRYRVLKKKRTNKDD